LQAPKTRESMVAVGDTAKVSGGKYDGKTGTVASVAAKTCTLIIEGAKTGNISLDAVKSTKTPSTPPKKFPGKASPPTSAIQTGDHVIVSGGKYDGQRGVVASVAAKTCTLNIDGDRTGNISLDALSPAIGLKAKHMAAAEAKQKAAKAVVDLSEVDLRSERSQDRKQEAMGPDVFGVANVRKTTCDGGHNWLREWETATGQNIGKCMILGCPKNAEVGGHMYLEGAPASMNYILPICQGHNQQREIDCDRNECARYVTTKNTFLLPITQNRCVYSGQKFNPLGGFDALGKSDVKEVRSTFAQDLVYNGTDIGAIIMFSAGWCPRCTEARPDFTRHLKRSTANHYVIKEEDNKDLLRRCRIKHFPTFVKVNGPGKFVEIEI